MNITIKNAKIKNTMFLEYGYSERINNAENEIKTQSNAPIHDDLANAFKALVPHFAGICEELEDAIISKAIYQKDDLSYLDNLEDNENPLKYYSVKGFSIGGSGDDEGVTISGNKKLQSGKLVNFNTPFTKFFDFDNYSYCSELRNALDNLRSEVYDYLEGKQAPPRQQSIDFEKTEENFEKSEI
jgi:hypothetical protein